MDKFDKVANEIIAEVQKTGGLESQALSPVTAILREAFPLADGVKDHHYLAGLAGQCATHIDREAFPQGEEVKERHEMHFIDATPDSGYITRILSSYIDESYFSDNTAGLPPENWVCKKMNEWREQRNKLLRNALDIFSARPAPAAAKWADAFGDVRAGKSMFDMDEAWKARHGLSAQSTPTAEKADDDGEEWIGEHLRDDYAECNAMGLLNGLNLTTWPEDKMDRSVKQLEMVAEYTQRIMDEIEAHTNSKRTQPVNQALPSPSVAQIIIDQLSVKEALSAADDYKLLGKVSLYGQAASDLAAAFRKACADNDKLIEALHKHATAEKALREKLVSEIDKAGNALAVLIGLPGHSPVEVITAYRAIVSARTLLANETEVKG